MKAVFPMKAAFLVMVLLAAIATACMRQAPPQASPDGPLPPGNGTNQTAHNETPSNGIDDVFQGDVDVEPPPVPP